MWPPAAGRQEVRRGIQPERSRTAAGDCRPGGDRLGEPLAQGRHAPRAEDPPGRTGARRQSRHEPAERMSGVRNMFRSDRRALSGRSDAAGSHGPGRADGGRTVPARAASGPRRHGRRVRGIRPAAAATGCGQGSPRCVVRSAGRAAAIRTRSAGVRPPQSPECRGDARLRRDWIGWRVPGHGAAARLDLARRAEPKRLSRCGDPRGVAGSGIERTRRR